MRALCGHMGPTFHQFATLCGYIVCTFSLAACQTTPPEPVVRTVEASIPVAQGCDTSELPAKPNYPDTDERRAAADNIFAGVAILLAGRDLRIKREAELEAALNECSKPQE